MLKNYISTILRQIKKHKTFSVINIIGLAVGMSACLVIAHYGYFHSSFDEYHKNSERIFRIQRTAVKNGIDLGETSKSASMMPQTMKAVNPYVENFTRFYNLDYQNNSIVYKSEKGIFTFEEDDVYATDKSTFDMFDIEFISGSAESFDIPNKIILTESSAKKYFEDFENAIGETVLLSANNGSENYEVVGIITDPPADSHLQFDVLISIESIKSYVQSFKSWTGGSYFSYLLLTDPEKKEEVISDMYDLYKENAAQDLEEYGYTVTSYRLLNLTDIHLKSTDPNDFIPPMNEKLVYGLVSIAIIILVIAWINYLNLSLVKTLERMKEVGIRKVLGSNSFQISLLFVVDALLLNLISFVMALTLVQLAAPAIASLTGTPFNLLDNLNIIWALLGLIVIGSTIIGFYPSVILKTLNTTNILMGNRQTKVSGGLKLRSVLVTTQFIITFLLLAVTITVYQQISFMKSADLGFDKDDIMVIKAPPGDVMEESDEREDLMRFNAFKTELLKKSGVKAITNAGEIPGEPITWGTNIYLNSKTAEQSVDTRLISMGSEFIDFFNLEVVAGRGVMPGDDPWNNKDVFINEKMADLLGFDRPENAIGAELSGFWAPLEVRGIIENHHHNSLHDDYQPIAYILSSWTEYYFIKFNIGDQLTDSDRQQTFSNLVTSVESEWDKSFPDRKIDYFFLDRFYNKQYAEDEHFGKVFGVFSTLAIVIACLGLFGLTSFTLKQRTKEIGIRKVLGASSENLILLLSRGYLLIIGIAYIISMPIAWILMKRWLENYAFHVDLGAWILVIPLAIVLLVALSTLISRLLVTIRMNPVNSLRNE